MSRYIDANKLKKSLSIPCASIIDIGKAIIAQIDDQPTADVVEVVRCKDCKWYRGIGCAIKIVDESDEPTDNDYCSYGERAEE